MASAIFYVQGGIATRSWHERNGHPPVEFPDLDGIRATTDVRLQPNKKTDVILSKQEVIPVRDAVPQLFVADVDYKKLALTMTFNTQFTILGRCVMQLDIVMGSDYQVLGLSTDLAIVKNASFQPMGPVILRPLDELETFGYNRAWRAYIPVVIKLANPVIKINFSLTTNSAIPPSFDSVFINVTTVVQIMNSFLKYIGYAGEDDSLTEDFEFL